MRVTIVYQYYQGHDAPGHSLIYDLAQYLAEVGHKITIVTGETGYMKYDMPMLPWYRRLYRIECEGNVEVVRLITFSESKKSYRGRLMSFLLFSLSCSLALLIRSRPDVLLASSPPLFAMFSASMICKLRNIPFVIEIRDLWPESAVQMGFLKNKLLIQALTLIERLMYNHSRKIVALTTGIRNDICARGWETDKVDLVTCGIDFNKIFPDEGGGLKIRERYGWNDKKVVLYFGALGEANNINVILRAAHNLKNRQDIIFVLVGDGMKRSATERWVADASLENVFILPPVPKKEARLYISAADLCLATLQDIPLFKGAIPTKLIDYMGCGKPVLCGIRGEARKIVEEAGAGVFFEPDDADFLSILVTELLADGKRTSRMGERGLVYVKSRFSAAKTRQSMETILKDVVEDSHKN